jgi:peroxiredoxin family protein/TusA-related sulfurtransferase
LRGYLAERILKQNGFKAANLSGGYLGWKLFHPDPVRKPDVPSTETKSVPASKFSVLDVRSLPCPGPVMKLKKAMTAANSGEGVHLLAAPTFESDLLNWAKGGGHQVLNLVRQAEYLEADVVKGALAPASSAPVQSGKNGIAMVVFSNDFDKTMAALILANGFAAAGTNVTLFFTFWGLSVLRKNPAPFVKKNLISRMFGWMLPKGATKLALSKMNMMGMGSAMMKSVMKQKGVLTLPELIRSAREAGVKFIACDMAMDVMGITREELIEVDEVAGVATFASIAENCSHTLFI